MERIKRNRRFVGVVLIAFAIAGFVAVHAPMFFAVPHVSCRLHLRFASLFVYSLVYGFIMLGANIRRTMPVRLARKHVHLKS